MLKAFTYASLPGRVLFGTCTLTRVGDEAKRPGCGRVLVLSTAEQEAAARALMEALGNLAVGLFAGAVMHTPVTVTNQAMAVVRDSDADCIVSLGGGSTTGLGKAIALRTNLPQYLDSDAVFGIKNALIDPFPAQSAPPLDGAGIKGPWRQLAYEFRLDK